MNRTACIFDNLPVNFSGSGSGIFPQLQIIVCRNFGFDKIVAVVCRTADKSGDQRKAFTGIHRGAQGNIYRVRRQLELGAALDIHPTGKFRHIIANIGHRAAGFITFEIDFNITGTRIVEIPPDLGAHRAVVIHCCAEDQKGFGNIHISDVDGRNIAAGLNLRGTFI